MKNLIYIFIALMIIVGCGEKSVLEMKVMEVHDEVMPKLGKLNKLRSGLSKSLPSITDQNLKKTVLETIKNLEDADDGMMDWMAEWKIPAEEPQKTEYLKSEMIKINKVKKDMLESMDAATALQSKIK